MRTVFKHQLSCCALCQMTANNNSSLFELQNMVDNIKIDSKKDWNPMDRRSGERAIFTIVSPYESILEENLKTLKFEQITTFNRRKGYPSGELKMYFLKF